MHACGLGVWCILPHVIFLSVCLVWQRARSVLTVHFSYFKVAIEATQRMRCHLSTTVHLHCFQLLYRARSDAYAVFDASTFASSTEAFLFPPSIPIGFAVLILSACVLTIHCASICVPLWSW